MICRHCSATLEQTFIDLGFAPPSNAYLSHADLIKPEKYYPLKAKVCTSCWLVQTEDYAQAEELFCADYAYFSSTSSGWLEHATLYSKYIIKRLKLNANSHVIEIASNDGYLLKNFIDAGIPCLGIEPTGSTADAAEKLGIPVLREFFGEALGKRLSANHKLADLIIGNNVFAHVPDINDFTRGLKAALKPGGTITLEFPHLMKLIEKTQFDTVYHEHFSYLTLYTVDRIFKSAGLRVWDVDELSTHGGSLRIYGCHSDDIRANETSVKMLIDKEVKSGLQSLDIYQNFQLRANKIKDDLICFLIEQNRAGKKIAAYGAAAKGNTLLNYAGVKTDLIQIVCDAAEAKQGKYMPGSHIPIMPPSVLKTMRFDFVLILPWNIEIEIKKILKNIACDGTQFVTAVPNLKIHHSN